LAVPDIQGQKNILIGIRVRFTKFWALIICFNFFLEILDLANEKIRKLFRSLSLIIIVNLGGYIIFMAGIVFATCIFPELSPNLWFINVYLSIILNISAALNAPILYINR